jgi:methylmalonyl-CoA carboxyltransferase large subunit
MVETIPEEVTIAIDDLRKQLAALAERLAKLEHIERPPQAMAGAEKAEPAVVSEAPGRIPDITEDELLAISGALAAYLGVRVHIRQIRLISSRSWSQQGRVSVQASHHLHS